MSGLSEGPSGPETDASSNAATKKPTADLLDLDGDNDSGTGSSSMDDLGTVKQMHEHHPVEGKAIATSSSSNFNRTQEPGRRGRKQSLPDDFLRPPGWSKSQLTLGDEQLALMLQNELFRREVQEAMGLEMFPRGRPGVRRGTGRPVQATYTGDGSSSGSGSGTGDLGIMKSLSEMGTGMKQRLQAMAASFSNRDTTHANTAGRDENGSREEGASMLSNPMQRRESESDDEDGEEVISFLESPAARTPSRSNNNSSSSSNPMLSYNNKKDK